LHGKQMLKYRFSSPADGCFATFYDDYQQYNPARTGRAWIEDPGGNVIRLDEEARSFPSDFQFTRRDEQVTWDYVKIGDASHLLPVEAKFLVLDSSGVRWRVDVEYRNHRHFEASTHLSF